MNRHGQAAARACRSSNRLMICAWIDTSSADDRLVADEELGPHGERPGNRDALALSAGELVGEAVGGGPAGSPTRRQPARRRPPSASARATRPWAIGPSRDGRPRCARADRATRYGSWKIDLDARRRLHPLARAASMTALAVEHRPRRQLGRWMPAMMRAEAWTCRSRIHRPGPGSRPRRCRSETPVDGVDRPRLDRARRAARRCARQA